MKEGNIIFVGGIHGVGKTKISTTLCQSMPLTHVTASSLIGTYKNKLDKSGYVNFIRGVMS